jgi:hypothetical protein
MKIVFALLLLCSSLSYSQPCKTVIIGMTSAKVLKAVGKPTEIDTLGFDKVNPNQTIVVWQYGNPLSDSNQRVQFIGDNVESVIANGKKFDDLMLDFKNGKVKTDELQGEIDKINKECK